MQWISGRRPKDKRKKYKDADKRILKILQEYQRNERTVIELLRGITQNIVIDDVVGIDDEVIAAEGEFKSSQALRDAALTLEGSVRPSDLINTTFCPLQEYGRKKISLRYLQTLNTISAEHNSTIVFPFPVDILSSFMHHQPQKDKNIK
ncbi:mechanosensory protein 2 [Ditylenchus destructor]|uniref:Mechanosensory protein 2 n=1 Tax=Ditylenchus destructor TaxID=166010 RepID=A0AAD4R3R6_9BILA|nr:mechanosensory protein 2 [Ditylenchus destructor]